jgi:hypothetical protein
MKDSPLWTFVPAIFPIPPENAHLVFHVIRSYIRSVPPERVVVERAKSQRGEITRLFYDGPLLKENVYVMNGKIYDVISEFIPKRRLEDARTRNESFDILQDILSPKKTPVQCYGNLQRFNPDLEALTETMPSWAPDILAVVNGTGVYKAA